MDITPTKDKSKTVIVRVSKDHNNYLCKVAKERDTTVSDIIRTFIESEMKHGVPPTHNN